MIIDDYDAGANVPLMIVHRTLKQGDRPGPGCNLTCRASTCRAAGMGLGRQPLHSSWAGVWVCQPESDLRRGGFGTGCTGRLIKLGFRVMNTWPTAYNWSKNVPNNTNQFRDFRLDENLTDEPPAAWGPELETWIPSPFNLNGYTSSAKTPGCHYKPLHALHSHYILAHFR